MTALIRAILVTLALLGLTACSPHNKFKTYRGPSVTLIEVHKSTHKMFLMHNATLLRSYAIELGGVPVGQKQFEGDGKTPEGAYFISHRNPNSTYHLSLGISYPNDADRAYAALMNMQPGGDIFIHGQPGWTKVKGDWTVGCIALSDKDMEEAYSMVNPGTQINIFP